MSSADEKNSACSGSDPAMTEPATNGETDSQRPGLWLARRALRLMDGLTGATLGALFYGSWGVYANSAHGLGIALLSGAAQGVMSFVVTLSGVTLMRSLYGTIGHPLLRAARAVLGALALIYGLIIAVHLWLGTPEILLTLAPGLPLTIGFCLIFTASLMRVDAAAVTTPPMAGRSAL